MTSVKLEIEHFNCFSVEDLFNMLPGTITTEKEQEPFNNFRLRIEKVLLYNSSEDKIMSQYLVNYYCDTTEIFGENAWFARKLLIVPIYDKDIRKSLIKLIIELFENNFIENIWSKK